jgi:hypothetical protein
MHDHATCILGRNMHVMNNLYLLTLWALHRQVTACKNHISVYRSYNSNFSNIKMLCRFLTWIRWINVKRATITINILKPVHSCNYCCDFRLRFSSSDGCERVDKLWIFRWRDTYTRILYTRNIHNSSTHSRPPEEENRTKNRRKNCKTVNGPLNININHKSHLRVWK